MQIRVELEDADGVKSTREVGRRWLLNYISSCLSQGREVVIVTSSGRISAVPERSGIKRFNNHSWNGLSH